MSRGGTAEKIESHRAELEELASGDLPAARIARILLEIADQEDDSDES